MKLKFCRDCGRWVAVAKCNKCNKDLCAKCYMETGGYCLDCEIEEDKNSGNHHAQRQNLRHEN